MQVTVEQVEPCKVAISVEVEAEAVKRAIDQAYRDVAGKVAVPGFRKGRAPRHILERYVDADSIRERAMTALVPEYYQRALSEKGVEPVAQPDLDLSETLHPGQPFRFRATVPTQPEVQLCDYHGIPVSRRRLQVTEQDVDARMEVIRHRATRLEDMDAEVAGPGMIAFVDLDTFRGERRLKNRSQADVPVNMDDATGMPAFNFTIEGMRIGETREMPVHYPPEHQDRVLAGKDVIFHITLKALKRRVVPELTDEFAREVAGVENLEELRAKAREDVEHTAQEVADRDVRDQLVEHVVSRSEVHFPEVLVQEHVSDAMAAQARELEQRETTLDEYLQERGLSLAAYERELREDTRRRIRTQLVLDAIADKDGLRVSEEDLDAEIAHMAAVARVAPGSMRAMLERQGGDALRGMRMQILIRKVVDVLQQSARITEE